jgi:hypothetical protein
VGLSTIAVQGLLSAMASSWWSPVARANPNRFSPLLFGIFGIAPLGYAVFAVALGVCAGIVIGRTLPAMAVTLLTFVGARVAVTFALRPEFAAAARRTVAVDPAGGAGIDSGPGVPLHIVVQPPALPNSWVRSIDVVNSLGQPPSGRVLERLCPRLVNTVSGGGETDMHSAFSACITRVAASFRQMIVYQPASRYWSFQWAELGVFIAFAAGLAVLSAWWLRRRLA